jgi:hypothetical protein
LNTPAIAAAQILDLPRRFRRETEVVHQPIRPTSDSRAALAMEAGKRQQVVADGQQQLRGVLLDDDDDLPPHVSCLPDHVEAHHRRVARCRPDQRGQDAQRGRLARAVGTEQPEDRARFDAETEAVDGARPRAESTAEILHQGVDAYGRVSHDRSLHIGNQARERTATPGPETTTVK